MNNQCVNGRLDGMRFQISTGDTRINYKHGYYLKSAIRENNITMWVWHRNDEPEIHPINPQ